MNKVCSKCKKDKETKLFGKRASRKDGLQDWCKECRKLFDNKNRPNRGAYKKEILKAVKKPKPVIIISETVVERKLEEEDIIKHLMSIYKNLLERMDETEDKCNTTIRKMEEKFDNFAKQIKDIFRQQIK